MSPFTFFDRARKVLQNKYFDGGVADEQNKVVLPANTTSNLATLENTSGAIAYDTTQSKVVYNNGSGFQDIAAPFTGANTSLSNLTSVAVNANIDPASNNLLNLGDSGLIWAEVNTHDVNANTVNTEFINGAPLVFKSGSFYEYQSPAGSGAIDFNIDNATTRYTLIWPTAQASGTQVLQNNGSGVLTWASGGSGANTQLSNLSGTTAVPVALLPESTGGNGSGNAALGSSTAPWGNSSFIFDLGVTELDIYDVSAGFSGYMGSIYGNNNDSVWGHNDIELQNAGGTGNTIGILLNTIPSSSASTNTQDLVVSTGNATGSTSNSGNIILQPGTATGNQGFIKLNGAMTVETRLTTGDTTVTYADKVLLLNDTTASGSFNINLPAGVNGLTYSFTQTSASSTASVTYAFVAHGPDTFDGTIFTGPGTISPIAMVFQSGAWYAIQG